LRKIAFENAHQLNGVSKRNAELKFIVKLFEIPYFDSCRPDWVRAIAGTLV
jgi:hypothetical protein